jgi:hypothetical protein
MRRVVVGFARTPDRFQRAVVEPLNETQARDSTAYEGPV